MENLNENQNLETKKLPLTERLDNWWLDKNSYKGFNGGCAIEADPTKTLQLLSDNVMPRQDNLPDLVRTSVEGHDKQHRALEVIWAEKIAEGATHVGVLEGSFHFFKGEDILPEDNVDLRISALPPILQFREREHEMIAQVTHVKEVRFRDDNQLPGVDGGGGDFATNIPDVQPGDDFAAGDTALT